MTRAIARAVERGVEFLVRHQLAHGELSVYRHTDRALSGPGHRDASPFVTTFVLHALDAIDHAAAPALRDRALDFLEAERAPPGVWRYWSARQGVKIDPDLDDTACASFALRGRGPQPNVELLLANRHPSGLFKTWLRSADADNDVDGVVNANVLLYLGERPETCAARDIVVEAINAGREAVATVYYVDRLALHHAVSRAFAHGVTGFAACRDAIADQLASAGDTALPSALALCTAIQLGLDRLPERRRRVDALLAQQRRDGSWPRAAFYAGPEPPAAHAVWWGSEELTTALCLDGLARAEAA